MIVRHEYTLSPSEHDAVKAGLVELYERGELTDEKVIAVLEKNLSPTFLATIELFTDDPEDMTPRLFVARNMPLWVSERQDVPLELVAGDLPQYLGKPLVSGLCRRLNVVVTDESRFSTPSDSQISLPVPFHGDSFVADITFFVGVLGNKAAINKFSSKHWFKALFSGAEEEMTIEEGDMVIFDQRKVRSHAVTGFVEHSHPSKRRHIDAYAIDETSETYIGR